MALRVVTVMSAGGDYSSLSAAFVGEVGNLTAAGLDRQLRIDCSAMTDAFADTGAGFTTDATHFMTIQAVDNHHGVMSTGSGSYLIGDTLRINTGANFTVLLGLCLSSASNGFDGSNATNVRAERCIGTALNAGTVVFYGDLLCVNCIGTVASGSSNAFQPTSGTMTCYNCLAIGNGFIAFGGPMLKTVNCLFSAQGVTGSFGFAVFSGSTFAAGTSNCASSDANVPTSGSGHRASQTFIFTNAAGGDYSLTVDDPGALRYGTDLSADPTYAFTTDITGATRSGTWDVGPFQHATVAARTWTLNDSGLVPLDQTFASAAIAGSFGPDAVPWELQPYATAATAFGQRSDFWPLSMLLEFPSTGTTASGSVAVSLALAGTAQQKITGTGSVAVAPRLSGTGQQKHTGTGSVAVVESLSGTAQQKHTASGTVALALSLNGTGLRGNLGSGSVAVTESLSGSAQQKHAASGTVAVVETLSGTGLRGNVGSGSLAISESIAGTAQQKHTASGGVAVALTLAGAGLRGTIATGGASVLETLSGVAQQIHAATGDARVAPSLSSTGQQQHSASGDLPLALTLSGSASVPAASITGSGDVAVAFTLDGLADTTTARRSAGFIYPIRTPTQHVQGDGNIDVALSLGGSAGIAHHASGGVSIRPRVDGVSVTLDPGPEFNPPVGATVVVTSVGAPVIAAPEPPQQQVTGSGNVNLAPRIGGSAQIAHHATGGVALEAILGGTGQLKNVGRGSVRVSPALSGRGGQSHTAAGHVAIDYATLGLGRVWTPELEAQERVEEEDTDTMAVIAALYYGML